MIAVREMFARAGLILTLGTLLVAGVACQGPAPTDSPPSGASDGARVPEGSTAEEPAAPTEAKAADSEVIVYTSVDQVFAEPILKAYAAKSGIDVKPVYDVEASKTTGLVNRLLAEKPRPLADVWWNGEFAQTVELAKSDVLAPYTSPSAADIPSQYVDKGNLWTGFGGRARVFLVNTTLMKPAAYPKGIDALAASPEEPNMVGMAHPVFGTAGTQAAALYAIWGTAKAKAYYESIQKRGIRIVDGNSVVRDLVASGELAWGITDTDDACGAIEKGAPVEMVFPDQGEGQMGTLVIPNTVALVKGGPHPDAGKALIDHLLSPEVTKELIKSGWFQIPLRPLADAPTSCVDTSNVKGMQTTLPETAAQISPAQADLADVFVR